MINIFTLFGYFESRTSQNNPFWLINLIALILDLAFVVDQPPVSAFLRVCLRRPTRAPDGPSSADIQELFRDQAGPSRLIRNFEVFLTRAPIKRVEGNRF